MTGSIVQTPPRRFCVVVAERTAAVASPDPVVFGDVPARGLLTWSSDRERDVEPPFLDPDLLRRVPPLGRAIRPWVSGRRSQAGD